MAGHIADSVGDLMGTPQKDQNGNWNLSGRLISGLTQFSALAASASGGSSIADINTATNAAKNEVEENCLEHGCKSIEQLLKEATMPIIEGFKNVVDAVGKAAEPDYATANVGALSGNAGVAVNLHDGTTFVSGGVSQTFPPTGSFKLSPSASIGWIFGDDGAQGTNNFLGGDGGQAFISIPTPWKVNFFGAISQGYGGGTAIELGVSTLNRPQIGLIPLSHSTVLAGERK